MKKILLLLFLCPWLHAKADSWTQKSSYPGDGQELPISFSIGNKGYAGCGSGASDFWEYDPAANSWTQKANVPGASVRRGGVGFSIGNKGYVGTGDNSGTYLNDFYEYDPLTNIWTTKASLSVARGYGAGFSIGNKGYIGCGYASSYLSDFWEYNPATNLWTQKTSLPFVRRQCIGFSISDKGYIATGADGNYTLLNDLWEYDTTANTWTQKADLPAPGRVDARAFVICDKAYLMTGGESPFYADLWEFDPVLNQWVQKTSVPGGPRDDGASFAIGNKGYFGLGQLLGSTNTNDFWEYTPDDTCSTSSNMANFFASDTALCEKFCINYFDSTAGNITSWLWLFPGGNPSSSTDQNPTTICYDSPGTYDVTLITTNANGNDTLTLHNYITVYPTPPFPTITQADYTLTSSPASSYQWQFNTTDIPGATNQSYDVMQTGLYTVIAGDSNNCVNSANKYVLIEGVDDLSDNENIFVFPNPSNGHFMVEWLNASLAASGSSAGDEISISIFNALGQEMFSSEASGSIGTTSSYKKEIDISGVAPGVYFLEINSNHFSVKRKIVIER